MTKQEAIYEALKVWKYMSEKGCDRAKAYLDLGIDNYGLVSCSFCTFDAQFNNDCTKCPMYGKWGRVGTNDKSNVCAGVDTIYRLWNAQKDKKGRKKYAKLMYEDIKENLGND